MKHDRNYHSLNAFKTEAEKSIDVSSLVISSNQVDMFRVLYLQNLFSMAQNYLLHETVF